MQRFHRHAETLTTATLGVRVTHVVLLDMQKYLKAPSLSKVIHHLATSYIMH